MRVDVRHLRIFLAVAEAGSIHGGARRLMIAQPALSQALRKLERDLDTTLLVRSHKGVELTDAGTALLHHARDLLARFDQTVNVVHAAAEPRGVLRVGLICGLVAAADLTGPILAAYRHRHPQLRVELHELSFADQVDALADGRVDVAVVRPPYFDEPIVTVPLFTEPIVLCMKADHRFADATSLPLDDLLDEPLVQLVNTPRRWMDFWHFNGIRNEAARTRPDPAKTLSELQLTLLNEDVVQPASVSAWRHGMASPRLRAVPIEGAPSSEIAVGFRRGEVRTDILDFAQCATEVARELIDLVPGGALALAT